MKLALRSPCRNKSASHSLSLISVLRPGMDAHMLSIDQDDAAALFRTPLNTGLKSNSGRFHGDHCDGQAL